MSHTLRDLPLPVKVVATVFLLAVGVGYSSAMLQLHLQDSKSGKPMPTPDDVVLKFTGKKPYDPNAPLPPAPASRLEALITGDTPDITGNTMVGAFNTQDRAPKALKFAELVKTRGAEQVRAERKGEQVVFALWIRLPDAQRKAAYTENKFVPPADKTPKALTPELKDGDAIKIKTLIDVRCATCHSNNGEKPDPSLDTYAGLLKFLPADAAPPKPVRGYIKVEEPISISKLTQSTHAHLLSFATLFSLTGLIFALSSWPAWVRVVVGPSVVVAIFTDVSMWWLARLCDEFGPFFAMAVIGTGFVSGVGLFVQIVGSLFAMYGLKGRTVLGLLFVAGGALGAFFVTQLLIPALPKKVEEKQVERPDAGSRPDGGKPDAPKSGKSLADGVAVAAGAISEWAAKTHGPAPAVSNIPRVPVNDIDRLLRQPPVDKDGSPLDGKPTFNLDGTMVPALFDKDKTYKALMESDKPQAEKDRLKAHREGDLEALAAWARTPDAARKSAYEGNAFDLPGPGAKAPTPEFAKGGKVLIKTLIDNRCATCHSPTGAQADYPLTTYKELSLYLAPNEAAPPAPPAGAQKPLNELERLLRRPPVDEKGTPIPPEMVKFGGGEQGTMVPALFEKDKAYKAFMEGNKPQAEKDKLKAHRDADLEALVAWARAPEPARKAAYDTDKFALPANSKPVSPDLLDGKDYRIKTLITNQCATCHGPDGKQADYPLDTYKALSEYLKPFDAPK